MGRFWGPNQDFASNMYLAAIVGSRDLRMQVKGHQYFNVFFESWNASTMSLQITMVEITLSTFVVYIQLIVVVHILWKNTFRLGIRVSWADRKGLMQHKIPL